MKVVGIANDKKTKACEFAIGMLLDNFSQVRNIKPNLPSSN